MKKQLRCVTIVRRKLLLYVMSALALIMAVVACSVTSSALLWSGVSTRKVPVYRVDTEKKKIAISFDAAWGADKTCDIIETITAYDIKANFFRSRFLGGKIS